MKMFFAGVVTGVTLTLVWLARDTQVVERRMGVNIAFEPHYPNPRSRWRLPRKVKT